MPRRPARPRPAQRPAQVVEQRGEEHAQAEVEDELGRAEQADDVDRVAVLALVAAAVVVGLGVLGQMTAPFRLSRTNKEVGNALPPVNTVYRYIDMGQEQAEVYETMRATLDHEVRTLIADSGLAKNQISILAAIGRLRQICCHPALVKSDHVQANVPSAKLDYLLEMVEELRADGRAVVIVSQWVEMLKIIGKALDGIGIEHRMFYGVGMSLTKRRQALATFREGRVPCLLMSLGVGGVGLDIPEADDIVLFDPWWNPAVEQQATDRAHRIGQTKVVTAYRLVAAGTIEEKILLLKAKKRELVASVLSEDSGGAKKLTKADLEELFSLD